MEQYVFWNIVCLGKPCVPDHFIFWNIDSFLQNISQVITCSGMEDTIYFFIVSSGTPYVLTMLGHCPKKSTLITLSTHITHSALQDQCSRRGTGLGEEDSVIDRQACQVI